MDNVINEEFSKKAARLKALQDEAHGLTARLAEARAAVETNRAAREAAVLAEVVEGTPAAAVAVSEAAAALESSLEARDRLEERGAALTAGIGQIKSALARIAGEYRKAKLAEATAAARAKLTEARPAVESVLIQAGLVWLLSSSGPLDEERLGAALHRGTGLGWANLRAAVLAEFDRLQAEAGALTAELQGLTNGR